MKVKRCIVCNRQIWFHWKENFEYVPGHWTCGWKCWKTVAAAEEVGLGHVYIDSSKNPS